MGMGRDDDEQDLSGWTGFPGWGWDGIGGDGDGTGWGWDGDGTKWVWGWWDEMVMGWIIIQFAQK